MTAVQAPVFGRLLKRYRAAAGLTQEELANRAGLSPKSIGDLETGRRHTPRRDTLMLLEDALQLPAHERAVLEAAARRHPLGVDHHTAPSSLAATPAERLLEHESVTREVHTTNVRPITFLPVGTFLGAAPGSPLVGRDAELAAVLTGVATTAEGSGRLLLAAGESGVGKTRFSQEIMRACHVRGFVVATGRCYEPHRTVPYYPFIEVISALCATAAQSLRTHLPTRWPALLRLLPDQPLSMPPTMGISPQEEEQRLFWAVSGLIQELSQESPVALLLDDFHWADDASLALLQHLARHTRSHRVLLMATYRDVEVGRQHPLARALRDLERESLVERVVIRRLGPEDTSRLIANTLTQSISTAFARLVHRHTDGNPLFVLEVLRALIERGAIYQQDGRWACHEIASIEAPESVRAIIADRVSRLSVAAQEMLYAASVLGQAFTFEDLQAMSAQSEEMLDVALEEARAAGLVQESQDTGYIFNHALTQQALYVDLPARRRRRLHLAAGEALERLPAHVYQRRASELSWHFREGGAPERALPYAILAGNHAASMYCAREAEKHYRTALGLAESLQDRAGQARALEKLGWLNWMLDRFDPCADFLERSAHGFHHIGDIEGEMRAVALLGMLYYTSAPLDGVQRVSELLDRLGPRAPSRPLALLHTSLALNLLIAGKFRETIAVAERAAVIARALDDTRMLVRAETARGPALGMMGHLDEARKVLSESIPLAEATKDFLGLLLAAHYLGEMSCAEGDFDAALEHYRRALQLAEQLGTQSRISAEMANIAGVLFYQGQWQQARDLAERAVELARVASAGRGGTYFHYARVFRQVAEIRAAMGEWEEAEPIAVEAVTMAERLPFPEAIRSGCRLLAEHDLRLGQPGAALARIEPLMDTANANELGVARLLPCLAVARARLGDPSGVEHLLTEGIAQTSAVQHRLALVDLLIARGTVLSMQLRNEESQTSFEAAITLARTMKYPYAEARALYGLGRMHGHMGEWPAARRRLEQGLAIFRRLGARSDTERTEQALAESTAM